MTKRKCNCSTGVHSVLRVEDHVTEAIQDIREVVLVGDDEKQFLTYTPYEGTTVRPERVLEAAGLTASDSLTVAEVDWRDIPMTSTWKVRRSVFLDGLKSQGAPFSAQSESI